MIAVNAAFEPVRIEQEPALIPNPEPLPSRSPGPRTGSSACDAAPLALDLARGSPRAMQQRCRRLSPIEDERLRAPPSIAAECERIGGGAPVLPQFTCNCPPSSE
ncbi:hypothetical protein [Burkholderia pseudomallei]|uniref:hypothetical protein n=1 Tax=Burkholderia pseudomallei TaxID=28450 RepID=UPI001FB95EB6|nr:hypothetical protein [Burkholderia pseudomallei]